MSRGSHCRGGILRRARAAAGALVLGTGLLGGTAILAATPASAIPIPPSTSSCTYNGSPVAFAASNTTGTPVTVACTGLPANTLLIVAQTSPLAGVISPSSAATSEADLTTGTAVTTSATGTLTATITVTATGGSPGFSALDKKAVCPPTQAQVNAGLTNCVVTVADLATTTGLNFGNIIYGTQPTPHRPTLALTPSQIGKGGGTLTASDKADACPTPVKAKSRCWWGAALTGAPNPAAGVPGFTVPIHGKPASNTLAASSPVYCFKNATAAACAGLPVGTLIGPHLSGTIAYPRSATVGHKEVVALEPNTTPVPGNGPGNTVRARAWVCVTSPTHASC
ncbi:MAG: hypothetical protein J2P30_17700 [Actinobacteria bacterium]|nr:hypothetical protein [Actinomycetota bacterium]